MLRRNGLIATAITLGTVALGGGYAIAAHRASSATIATGGTITGCVGGNGRLRVVPTSGACRRGEQVLTWNTAAAAVGGSGGHTSADVAFTESDGHDLPGGTGPGGAFEIKDFSFGVENPTTIGSATGGAGAGKVKFNEFTITRKIDSASPLLFKNAVTGAHYKTVTLSMRKAGGPSTTAGAPFLVYTFGTVFTTKITTGRTGDAEPQETITFEYGKLDIKYTPQSPTGAPGAAVEAGWDQLSNVTWLP